MKPAIVYVAGLGTDPAGDLLGIRPFFESLAASIGGTFAAFAWNDSKLAFEISRVLLLANSTKSPVYSNGHSHGAAELLRLHDNFSVGAFAVSCFLDECPPNDPFRWLGPDREAPKAAKTTVSFFQRRDALIVPIGLCGVKMRADAVYDFTKYGGHTDMPGHLWVQTRIKLAIMEDYTARLSPVPAVG